MDQKVNAKTKQEFGENPTEVRESDHYVDEYVTPFVEKWDELIDWEGRAEGEGSFYIDKLKEYGAKKVLDVATGTGFHSVRMLKAGFDVRSVDGSPEMLTKAFNNARDHGCMLRTVCSDWRSLSQDIHEKFDAVICLGNSFTHLFSRRDRRKALAEFYSVLKYDGILILDQRNYDSIMDHGFSTKHKYYYCGKRVVAEPAHVDEGLARFQYTFDDGAVYFLNMFPLRRKYLRGLAHDIGYQRVNTYGDFQSLEHLEDEPDFFTHVIEKVYDPGKYKSSVAAKYNYSDAVNAARNYYNSDDADNFYFSVWGGEDIHIGIRETEEESINITSRRTVEKIAAKLDITSETRILDLGSGYGGAARYLAKNFDCRVTALNLSEIENERSREMDKVQGVDHLVEVLDGSFEDVPLPDSTYDIIWSQDAILHSGDREKVIEEVARLLKPGGEFIFTDPMMTDDCPRDVLQPILDRIHLDTLGSPRYYRDILNRFGFEEKEFDDYSQHLSSHYQNVLSETERREKDLVQSISPEYIENMKKGLQHWVDGGKSGHLVWGIFHFVKRRTS